MTSFPRRRFFGLFPAAATSLVLGKETVAATVPVMPIQCLAIGAQGPIEVVRKLFPKGLPITQENGPAVIGANGYQSWWRDGKCVHT